MWVISKRNVFFKNEADEVFGMPKEYMGDVPEWVTKTDFFKALVRDGLVIVTETTKDKEIQAKAEVAEKKEQEARSKAKAKAKAEEE